jgi:hypothetical protein
VSPGRGTPLPGTEWWWLTSPQIRPARPGTTGRRGLGADGMPNDGQPVLRAGDPCAERRRGAVRPLPARSQAAAPRRGGPETHQAAGLPMRVSRLLRASAGATVTALRVSTDPFRQRGSGAGKVVITDADARGPARTGSAYRLADVHGATGALDVKRGPGRASAVEGLDAIAALRLRSSGVGEPVQPAAKGRLSGRRSE